MKMLLSSGVIQDVLEHVIPKPKYICNEKAKVTNQIYTFLSENGKCNARVHGTTLVIPNMIFKMSESDLLSELGWKIKNGWCKGIIKYCSF
jgi:hypothetical protein